MPFPWCDCEWLSPQQQCGGVSCEMHVCRGCRNAGSRLLCAQLDLTEPVSPPCGLLGAGTCWATRWTLASTPAWPKAGGRRGAASCTWSAPPPLSASCRAWWLTSWAPSSPEMSLKCRYLLPFLSFSLSLSPLSALYFLLFVHFLCRACFQCPISLK